MHFRPKRKNQSKFMFRFDKHTVQYCTSYRYLGANLNEFLDFSFTTKCQADSAGRALGSIITKMIKNRGLPYNVYSILYDSCITSTLITPVRLQVIPSTIIQCSRKH